MATALATLGTPAEAQYFALGKGGAPLEPYDVDYSSLADPSHHIDSLDVIHYVPLGIGPNSYVTFDGELREQVWSQNNIAYALRSPTRNTYDLQRLLASAYAHYDEHFAVFVQLGRYDNFGKINPSATDQDAGRLQQAFAEAKETVDSAQVTLRGGRQEIALGSGRFVWLNDSSNDRTTHDGVRAHTVFANGVTLDVVYTRPVTPEFDAFTDFGTHAGVFGAAYLSETVLPDTLHADEYYFYRRNIGGQYSGQTGNEDRDTVGGRLWGAVGSFLYDGEFAYQFGTFNQKEISAFGGSARALYTFEQIAWQPGLQLQSSYFSGGGSKTSDTIRTFSAPFPRPTMLNYIGINTLENLVEVYPALVVNPTSDLALRFGPEVLWRASVNDAVYISRATPLPATMAANDKASYIGTNLVATAQWRATKYINVFAEYLHELPGPAITLAGGKPVDAGVVQVSFRF